jgi:hypothetical protein
MKLVLVAIVVVLTSVGAVSCKSHGTCPAYGNSTIKKSKSLNNDFQVNQNSTNEVIGRN